MEDIHFLLGICHCSQGVLGPARTELAKCACLLPSLPRKQQKNGERKQNILSIFFSVFFL